MLINLPGHSGSIISDAIIRAPYASTSHLLLQTIRKVTHGPVIMLGYSLGARISLDLASRYPFLVSKLILESYNPGIDHYFERKKRRFIDSKWAKRFNENYSRALDQWYQQDLFKSLRNHPSYLTLYRARLLQDPLLMSTIIQVIFSWICS